MEVVPMWSAGVGFGYELLPWARLDSEARYRVPFVKSGSAAAFSRGWEYRVGLAISWRTGRRSSPPEMPMASAPRTTSGPAPTEYSAAEAADVSSTANALAFRIVDSAEDNLGTPYLWGGSTTAGFDCSGFVQHVFNSHDVKLPRTSRQMAQVGAPVSRTESDWRVGDLLFFAGNGNRVDHVAMYAGDGRIIHSTSTGGGVRYDQLTTNRGSWFMDHLVTVRRVLGEASLAAPVVADDDGPSDLPDKAPRARGRSER
jgi:cell wall-associated NlpC family hydrolase